mmetsp:Transcript_24073/g.37744  ORF Transcript_24073/g.37744 Transcript_24073/m.37744 type:complete len:837 (+) Transcript_24073:88-2598(+)
MQMESDSVDKQMDRSIEDIRSAKDARMIDLVKSKDEQIRILSEQNHELTSSLDRAEEELTACQVTKASMKEENQALREKNCHLHAKTESSEGHMNSMADMESQMETMSTKNAELFRLLEQEEQNNEKIAEELELCRKNEQCLQEKYAALVQSCKVAEKRSESATRDNRLKAEEIRVLRLENDHLKQTNSELEIKSTVELEAAEEQLRLRKEKQYQLLGKLQSQEATGRETEERTVEMEKNIKELRERSSELQTALRLETSARISENDANRRLTIELKALSSDNKQLNTSLQGLEQDRLALEAEARGNGEQLREMAEKVFQLLERLKLAELGKKKSMEALSRKEQELFANKKQYNRLSEDVLEQKRRREKVELEKRSLEEQLRGLKKANTQLGHKLKEEAKLRIRAEENSKACDDKVHTLDGRVAFLLNRLQLDEETISAQQEEMKKLDTQLQTVTIRCETLQEKLAKSEESGKETEIKLATSQKQLKDAKINLDAMEESIKVKDENDFRAERRAIQMKEKSSDKKQQGTGGGSRQPRLYVDSRSSAGHATITGKCPKDKAWIEERGCNSFLRRTFKAHNPQEALVKKISELYNTILFADEDKEELQMKLKSRHEDVESMNRELNRIQAEIFAGEESKRRILLRYIRAVKASVSLGEPGSEEYRHEVGTVGAGRIHLPESGLVDEDAYAIASLLKNNMTIEEIQLRRNKIGDDGARAIASVLVERSALKFIDLRENRISTMGMKAIADALGRSERINKVFVHPGGKIEAFGTSENFGMTSSLDEEDATFSVSSVCVVDARDNAPPKTSVGANANSSRKQKRSLHALQEKSNNKQRPP